MTVLRAGHGGGSGELDVAWEGVPGAIGYRVTRATAPTGPFSVTADINLATGKTTHAADVTNVFSYVEHGVRHFGYTELLTTPPGGQRHYFHVTAYNAAGEGPPSVLVCGTAVGYPDC